MLLITPRVRPAGAIQGWAVESVLANAAAAKPDVGTQTRLSEY
jgi:hypothetical protein